MEYLSRVLRFNVIVISVLFLLACSSKDQVVKKLPQRHIDRPYTLPDGVSSWGVDYAISHSIYSNGSSGLASDDENEMLLNPLNWQFSITDDFSYTIAPLPLGFKYQAYRDDTSTLGLSASTLFFISMAEINYQYKITNDFALKPNVNYLEFDFFGQVKQSGYELELLYQANNSLALFMGMGRARVEASHDFFSDLFGSSSASDVESDNLSLRKVGALYSLNSKLDFSVYMQETYYDEEPADKFQLLVFNISLFY